MILRPHNHGMKSERDPTASEVLLSYTALLGGTLARRLQAGPNACRRFVRLGRRVPWQLLMLLVGIVVQAGLVWMVWRLVHLAISLFEAWAMLARYSLSVT